MSVLVEQVTCSRHGQAILYNVSLQIKTGEVLGLLGPNGAGKTTLIRLLAGLARPDSGRIRVFGEDASRRSVTFRSLIGLVPQENTLESELTIEQSMLCTAKLYGIVDARARMEEVCQQFQIGSWRKKYPVKLSGGMKRRAMIARAMLSRPEFLLLDEPSVGLDPDMRQEIWQAVRKLQAMGKTVLLTTHLWKRRRNFVTGLLFCERERSFIRGQPRGYVNRFRQSRRLAWKMPSWRWRLKGGEPGDGRRPSGLLP
ncbi:ABC transporter ATP-binding protein [Selenomonas sp. ND2010]|uniref:ABC transporter ATP-binding protein n=1 Tax=Selenomonas sp. ND2010 TaxID=1410618 RepID=UPI000AAF564A|nr:ABC transporter ATP-binding protein [Selenomonas sp. ND2010]